MNLKHALFPNRASEASHLEASSRFSLRFMKRTNLLAILIFVVGISIKLLVWLFSR